MAHEVEHQQFNADRILAGCAIGSGLASLVAGFVTTDEMLMPMFKLGNDVLFWGGGILLVLGVLFAVVRD
ncbi:MULTISPECIES: hypothetical protein [unclassified Amycolatopsis]|uniref:hypothetical protein n=1 Tax=unclassified Amycolatopsis TaxID=2618356 RepID=UPI00129005D5|nr:MULTISPECIES: hypothetical protein [unclassified Amycolatopsis]MBN6038042.1 hypothetical protein [Amycolatopsis sp. 195334CR]QFU92181.1 hypothetical protein YIM_35105 [Amycolatopsis sp. YIM 10]